MEWRIQVHDTHDPVPFIDIGYGAPARKGEFIGETAKCAVHVSVFLHANQLRTWYLLGGTDIGQFGGLK